MLSNSLGRLTLPPLVLISIFDFNIKNEEKKGILGRRYSCESKNHTDSIPLPREKGTFSITKRPSSAPLKASCLLPRFPLPNLHPLLQSHARSLIAITPHMIILTTRIAVHFLARGPVMPDFPAVATTPAYHFLVGWVWGRLGSCRSNEVGGGAVSANVAIGVVVGLLRWGFDRC